MNHALFGRPPVIAAHGRICVVKKTEVDLITSDRARLLARSMGLSEAAMFRELIEKACDSMPETLRHPYDVLRTGNLTIKQYK